MTDNRSVTAVKQISLAEIEPVLQELLASGGSIKLTVTGTSNYPTMVGGRDQITLEQARGVLKKYDLPLYRRANGQYVLHRIVSVQKDGSFTCCGDNQWKTESGIRSEQVIGCVVRICRNGREFSVQSKRYRLWVRVWVLLLPCRSFLIRAFHAAERIAGKSAGKT